MIDNFNLIAEIIGKKSLDNGDFFFLEILKRKKDNPDMEKHVRTIQDINIKDATHLLEKKNLIMELCNLNNARAYFRLNKRNEKAVALETMKNIAICISNSNYSVKNCYASACGTKSSDSEKTWLVDIDWTDLTFDVDEFIERIRVLKEEANMDTATYKIPTKNGVHVITRPFNLKKLNDVKVLNSNQLQYAGISIHKDNPTILYHP